MGGDVWSPQEIAPTSQTKCQTIPTPFSDNESEIHAEINSKSKDKVTGLNLIKQNCIFWHHFIFILQKRKKENLPNKRFPPLYFKVFRAQVASWALFLHTLCLYTTSVFMWRGVGASAAGASWICLALPCTLWGSVLDRGPGPSLRHAALLQPLQSADSHWHYISWGDIVDCVCARLMLLSACCSEAEKQSRFADPLFSRCWIGEVSAVGKVEKALRHGCAHHTWNGGPGGIGQPARLEPGTSDPEEVVQPWADAMQTLPRSLVEDWKMLPGMTALTSGSRNKSIIKEQVLFLAFLTAYVINYLLPAGRLWLNVYVLHYLWSCFSFPVGEVSQYFFSFGSLVYACVYLYDCEEVQAGCLLQSYKACFLTRVFLPVHMALIRKQHDQLFDLTVWLKSATFKV